MENLLNLTTENEIVELINHYITRLRNRHSKSTDSTDDLTVRYYKLFLEEGFFLTYDT